MPASDDDDLPVRLTGPGKGGKGRASYKIGPRGLKIIEELSARGCSTTTIAKALRMGRDAFVACRRRQPEAEEAYQPGLAIEHDALTSNLRTMADKGNVIANLFLLKTRHGYVEGQPLEVNVSINTGGVLVVPGKMTVEEYIAQKRAEGEFDPDPPMRDVTPGHYTPPEPIEYMAEAPIPGSRGVITTEPDRARSADTIKTDRHPTGTRLGRTSTRAD